MSALALSELQWVAAWRFSAWASALLVAFALGRVLYERWPIDLRDALDRIILGSAIEALSWSVHQCYWWSATMCHLRGGDCTWFSRNGDVISLAYVGVLGGFVLLLSPITEKLLGGKWVLVSTLVVASLWVVGLAIAIGG